MIVGVDEVGRGPLAGPVIAAAVILSPTDDFAYQDSKQCSPKKREQIFARLMQQAVEWRIGLVSSQQIDRINILQAALLAMKLAVNQLHHPVTHVHVDGHQMPDWDYNATTHIKGDQNFRCIAAASIIAKVIRDQMMYRYDVRYPGYDFEKHKGYPTRAHIERLVALKPCDIHRRSFGPVKKIAKAGLMLEI